MKIMKIAKIKRVKKANNTNESTSVSKDIIGTLADRLPGALTGDPAELMRRYKGVRASGDAHGMIDGIRRRTTSYYLLLILALVLTGAALAQEFAASGGGIEDLERGDSGSEAKYVGAMVKAEYGGAEVSKDVSVAVQPKELSPDELADALDDLKRRLPGMILGENSAIDAVNADLNLITEDESTGATIVWRSENEKIIDQEGGVNLIDGKPGEEVILTADITLGEVTDELALNAVTAAPEDGYDYSKDIERSVENLVDEISGSTDGDKVSLPGSLGSGLAIDWKKPESAGAVPAIIAIPFIGFLVYRSRYRAMDKAVAEMRDSIKRDFPDFLSKLLLLLNAGLTSTAAVAKIADDYREHRRAGEEKVFFEELLGMEDRIRGANTSLSAEFSDLAARSGQREVMRFSSILVDNIDKGSALADKLIQEEGTLRTMRRKRAEEKGRLAETKLTFPMALQLGAIIIITVAPAAFEMQ